MSELKTSYCDSCYRFILSNLGSYDDFRVCRCTRRVVVKVKGNKRRRNHEGG